MTNLRESPRAVDPKLSKVEHFKQESRYLRGTIAEELTSDTSQFSEANSQLLKFHGTYEQYDRDTATARKQKGLEKEYQCMVRIKIPGGRLTADQYLAIDELAGRYANGSLRITTRQGFQLYAVIKKNLKATIAEINATLLTTLGACGDVVRNITTSPAPIRDAVHQQLERDAKLLTDKLLPRTHAYHEIWLDGERLDTGEEEVEPLYGTTYLPRKFKIGLATPEDNSIDVLTHDIGIIALFDGERLTGYNLALGGGMGMTHNKPKTYPRLATPLVFVEPDGLVPAVEAVIKLQRDYGSRSERKHARLKYLVDDMGVEWIKAKLEEYFGAPLSGPRPMPEFKVVDHLGWHPQGDGRWYLGIPVSSGRIVDRDGQRLRTALREVIAEYRLDPILTPAQDIILSDADPEHRTRIEDALKSYGVSLAEDLSPVSRFALACPALPTCGLALTEAERVKLPLIAEIEEVLARYGLAQERMSIRITGCPNGCARPYTGDIGIVGRMPGYYALYVGGDFEGTRLSNRLLDKVPLGEIAATLEPLFAFYACERLPGERFGNFCHRQKPEFLRHLLDPARAAAE
ncbi:MAG: NADPH-dependent assimilatory sulfite reductase hemoprotein subunit [Proteobacteria bacterium]|nr:NADPH-dependent assimilatory sulfite reductase hemoprotein subunit [Pseudomonadota bacterium]